MNPPAAAEGDWDALVCLAEAMRLAAHLGDRLWPGWEASSTPYLLFHPGGRHYLVNHPNAPPGFVRMDRAPLPDVHFLEGSILHEGFHAHRGARGKATFSPRCQAEYPMGPRNNALRRIEGELLAHCLESAGANDVERVARTAARADAVRRRHDLLPERRREIISKLPQLDGGDVSWSRFYLTGLALGVILEVLSPGWERREITHCSTLDDLLGAALKAGEPNRRADRAKLNRKALAQVLASFDYPSMLAQEQDMARRKERERRALVERSYAGSGGVLELVLDEVADTIRFTLPLGDHALTLTSRPTGLAVRGEGFKSTAGRVRIMHNLGRVKGRPMPRLLLIFEADQAGGPPAPRVPP